ncbi:histidinol-phosphatase [Methylocapsa acidiphila]|uniref:histidinol-phosphatase n=1 Tax=Methylocapsa acidiphila TaxID=133552 RepID=UPI0004058809|nr:histidinol-phosphatase [Methylocapsa acidiphila]
MTAVDFAAFVERLGDVASDMLLPFFRTALSARDKNIGGSFDPVTEADHAAETAMRRLIERTFPHHGVIGEEFGSVRSDAEYVWVLDPIDGTKSFIAGLPIWGSLIGLLHNGRPTYGMMVQPFTQERFIGDGAGAVWRGPGHDHKIIERKLTARSCEDLGKATLLTTSPSLYAEPQLEAFRRVEAQTRLSRYSGDCYAFAMLAAGHVDCVIESGLKTYDIAPLIPIIEGAGGVVTDWKGGDATGGGDVVACGDRKLHEQALKLLRG